MGFVCPIWVPCCSLCCGSSCGQGVSADYQLFVCKSWEGRVHRQEGQTKRIPHLAPTKCCGCQGLFLLSVAQLPDRRQASLPAKHHSAPSKSHGHHCPGYRRLSLAPCTPLSKVRNPLPKPPKCWLSTSRFQGPHPHLSVTATSALHLLGICLYFAELS